MTPEEVGGALIQAQVVSPLSAQVSPLGSIHKLSCDCNHCVTTPASLVSNALSYRHATIADARARPELGRSSAGSLAASVLCLEVPVDFALTRTQEGNR